MISFSIGEPAQVNRAFSLAELCAHEHSDFIRCAYLTVLGRLPDPDGLEFYRRKLVEGMSKLTILDQLRRSAEAANHDPGIAGFDRALRRHRRGNLPLIGPVVRLFTRGEAENRRARHERALVRQLDRVEARLLAIHIDCIDRIEAIASPRTASSAPKVPVYGLVPAGTRRTVRWTDRAPA